MPRFDGTGPCGKGPLTGGGMGFCVKRITDTDDPSLAQGPSDRCGKASGSPGAEASDGARPLGLGPMTGCAAGYPVLGHVNPMSIQGLWIRRWWSGIVSAYGSSSYGLSLVPFQYGVPHFPAGVEHRPDTGVVTLAEAARARAWAGYLARVRRTAVKGSPS